MSHLKIIALPILNPGARTGCVVSATSRPLYPRKTNPVPIVQWVGWTTKPVSMGLQNLAPLQFEPHTVDPVASRYTD
jgi:hypothetical protein